MRPSQKNIKEIAENLECGMICYFNVKTGELKTIINSDSWELAEEEAWEEDINEIEENQDAYIEFHGMSSHESFNLMVDFTDMIDDLKLKERLIKGLNKPKPFRNFKWEIDNSGEYRQQWFDFKSSRYISYVQDQIELESFE
ncbi:UPF0158 family protein [Carboxylicivirga sp. N1Y90]|uniref:UPF0158 family protein n=1 Tax=Carboxylicivirga fragile TaxID=3417571 RepID=UPI003D3505C5|nr:hypothetical protein [Marinilabiliaceae bacterium N1Y90]